MSTYCKVWYAKVLIIQIQEMYSLDFEKGNVRERIYKGQKTIPAATQVLCKK